jgi:DNA-binding transcriptional LysR family regulator
MEYQLKAFIKVAEHGNFTYSAEELGITPSAMSKLISRLEDRFGVKLFHRTTRKLSLTHEAETLLIRARDIVAAIEDAEGEISESGASPRGRLKINCVTGFAFHVLSQALPEFMQRYPLIQVDLATTDRIVDLVAENVDVGIRTGTVTDLNLVNMSFAQFERMLYTSPEYLRRHGTPQSPEQLANHQCVIMSSKSITHWPFVIDGKTSEIPINAHIVVDNAEAALRIVLAGGGIARGANMQIAQAMREGAIVPVLQRFHSHNLSAISAVYLQGRQRLPRVRVFLDFLKEKFSSSPWATLSDVGR